MKTYIIVGSGAAGISAAYKLRQLDKAAKIICFSSENYPPYNKCLLVDYICNVISEEKLLTRTPKFFLESDIDLKLNTTVMCIDSKKNTVQLSNNTKVGYDYLLYSTGTSASIPKHVITTRTDNIFTFHTLADATKIFNFLKNTKVTHATIVGAGTTGLELSDALISINIRVTLLEKSDRVFHNIIDKKESELIEQLLLKKRIEFLSQTTIQKIWQGKNSNFMEIVTNGGKTIETEMVIFTVGAVPNIQLAQAAGIHTKDNRILTTKKMGTNIENIFASGDVCLIRDCISQENTPSCTWPDAVMQGIVAASNMTGIDAKYRGTIRTISSKIFGTPFVFCGNTCEQSRDYKAIITKESDYYQKLVFKNEILTGFVMIGKIEKLGVLKNSILTNFQH